MSPLAHYVVETLVTLFAIVALAGAYLLLAPPIRCWPFSSAPTSIAVTR